MHYQWRIFRYLRPATDRSTVFGPWSEEQSREQPGAPPAEIACNTGGDTSERRAFSDTKRPRQATVL